MERKALVTLIAAAILTLFQCSKSESSKDDATSETNESASEDNDDNPDQDEKENEQGETASSSGALALGITEGTAVSAPSISALTQQQIDSAGTNAVVPGTLTISGTSSLALQSSPYAVGDTFTPEPILSLFRYECHEQYEPSGVNLCPDDLVLPDDFEDSFYGFSDSLLAKVRFAERYLGNVYYFLPPDLDCDTIECDTCDTCKEGCPAKCQSGSMTDYQSAECLPCNRCFVQNKCSTCNQCQSLSGFQSYTVYNPIDVTDDNFEFQAADSSSIADKYIIPVENLYDVISQPGGSNPDQGRYSISVKQTEEMERLAIVLFDGEGSSTGGSIQQVYASLDQGKSKLLAANLPAKWQSRSVLIENVQQGRFVIKSCQNSTYMTVIGKGGRDKETGELKPGFYLAAIKDDSNDYSVCVNNQTQKVVEMTNCSTEEPLLAGTLDLGVYFDMSTTEAADLAGFLITAGKTGHLTTDECPAGYEDPDWPDKIVVTE